MTLRLPTENKSIPSGILKRPSSFTQTVEGLSMGSSTYLDQPLRTSTVFVCGHVAVSPSVLTSMCVLAMGGCRLRRVVVEVGWLGG